MPKLSLWGQQLRKMDICGLLKSNKVVISQIVVAKLALTFGNGNLCLTLGMILPMLFTLIGFIGSYN